MPDYYPTRHCRALVCAGLLASGGLLPARAQTLPAAPPRRLTVQAHYGAAGNFFASSRRDTPYALQHVRFLGAAGGGVQEKSTY